MQGCRLEYIGRMNYHMMAVPEFAAQWFPNGLTVEDVRSAPAVIFDRQDELHHKLLHRSLRTCLPPSRPTMCHPLRNLQILSLWGLPMACCRISKARHCCVPVKWLICRLTAMYL